MPAPLMECGKSELIDASTRIAERGCEKEEVRKEKDLTPSLNTKEEESWRN